MVIINALRGYKISFNFFSLGEKMTDEKKQSDFDELEWQKACEAENNFQKAVEMVTSIFFPESEEDRQFVAKWLQLDPTIEKMEKN